MSLTRNAAKSTSGPTVDAVDIVWYRRMIISWRGRDGRSTGLRDCPPSLGPSFIYT